MNKFNKCRFLALFIAVAFFASGLTSLYQVSGDFVVSAQPAFLDVSISGKTKLGVNETGTYTANVANSYSGNLEYSWTITPADDKALLLQNGASCSLVFLCPTEDPYSLSVQVKDNVVGNLGSASITVYDPYTSPNTYLGSYGAPYSYLIETDGLGWYRAINGQTGAISWSSTNQTYVTQQAILAGGTINLNNLQFDYATLQTLIPANTSVIENYGGKQKTFIAYNNQTIVCLGDSITYGTAVTTPYPTTLSSTVAVNVVNAGVHGDYTSQIKTRWDAGINTAGYDMLVYMGGTNDISNAVAIATIESNIEYVVTDAVSRGMIVYVNTVPPYVDWDAGEQTVHTNLNTWITNTVPTLGGTVIDVCTALADPETPTQLLAAYDSGDHIHPSQAGADVIASTVAAAIDADVVTDATFKKGTITQVGSNIFAQDDTGRYFYYSSSFNDVFTAMSTVLSYYGGTIMLEDNRNFASSTTLNAVSNVTVKAEHSTTITVTSTSNAVYGVTFDSVTDCLWQNINVVRAGSGTGGAGHFLGTTDNSVQIYNCNFTVTSTGTTYGALHFEDSAAPIIWYSNIVGGPGSSQHGAVISEYTAPIFMFSNIYAGPGYTGCDGLYLLGNSKPLFIGSNIFGGNNGTYSHGVYAISQTAPVFKDSNITSITGGSPSYCVSALDSAYLTFDNVNFFMQTNSTNCNAIKTEESAVTVITDSTILIDAGATGSYGVYATENSMPVLTGTTIAPYKHVLLQAYNSADNGRFRPFTGAQYQVYTMCVNVKTATADTTLSLGTSAGGTQIASDISLSTTGRKYFNFSLTEIAANGYMYATPNGTVTNGTFDIEYTVIKDYATCGSLYIATQNRMIVNDCTLISNGNSNTVSLISADDSNFRITNSYIETLDRTNQYSIHSNAEITEVQIYNNVLFGGTYYVTFAGAESGTNILA